VSVTRRFIGWLLAPFCWLLEGSFTSGTESCNYLRRLAAVPPARNHEERRAA
jgi:hypothetical protein